MPKASAHQSTDFTRLLLMGPSGTGKTGSLLSLLRAGYQVSVIDMDNGLDWLVNKLRADAPDLLDKLDYQTFRDKYKMGATGAVVSGVPKAYTSAVTAMGKWDDETIPAEWGPDRILVLDSLTFFGNAAYAWADALTPPSKSGFKDPRQVYGGAQDAVESVLDALTSKDFKANVIVLTHVRWNGVTDEKGNFTVTKGVPSSIGAALSEKLGTYFNNVGLYESVGTKRQIRFESTGLIDLKSAAVKYPLGPKPIDTALADFFKAARAA